ncbi:hypothetical protein [uncultured Methylibium sp.]|uniref:hypothetical protein n=1 Tax=uncultured Methylibium sp. TaxID=381093 RepID=UPI0025E898BC|nr:hypothetical protein [uncultured Methylibium sp.]
MKPRTAGERLFLLLRDGVFDSLGNKQANWANFSELISRAGGDGDFADYVRGAMSAFAMRRLLRFWASEIGMTPDEANHVRRVSRFINEDLFPSLDAQLTAQVARGVIAAHAASSIEIPVGVRKLVVRDQKRLHCYLCRQSLDPAAGRDSKEFLTLEHLWPTSIGGDSVEANLLPACLVCQKITKDTISWEWVNVHNYVLPPQPSAKALDKGIGPRVRYARHYLEVLRLCDAEGLTLKESFLKVGPMNSELRHRTTRLPVTFFDLETA